ncbi:MAG: alpha/beta hydrolase [Betaproteobacteria bacterium]|nr:alpha/beta hydrolase [Betaproteobacteria bacterium]
MPFATINGIRINYLIQGSGPPLLMFAPGGFRSLIARWTAEGSRLVFKDMDVIGILSRHFTCIAYDRRECGLSGGRVEPLSWPLYADEAKGVLDLAGGGPAYVLGGCMGASLALALALRHPQACKGLLLHWPVGGWRWMQSVHGMFQRHIDFVRAHGLAGLVARQPQADNFFLDPEMGPWGSTVLTDPAFASGLAARDTDRYLAIVAQSRDNLFPDTMPSGVSGEELPTITTPSLILSGNDASHAVSAAWALKELLPNAHLWDVLPPDQTGENTIERILAFTTALESEKRS